MKALEMEIKLIVGNDKENLYLNQYQSMVYKQCKHLQEQADEIVSVQL